ncbi:MAG: FtsX-like permease family protein [Candidatus Eisenbacteria bacterium]|nr:FtsX-like permease family protein [Candidatus Eisenbacteria bacterium]
MPSAGSGTMGRLIVIGARNLTRNRRRSLLTMGTVALAVATMIMGDCYLDGITASVLENIVRDQGHVRILHAEYARRERALPLRHNIASVGTLQQTIAEEYGEVMRASPRIRFPAILDVPEGETGSRNQVGLGIALDLQAEGDVVQAAGEIIAGSLPGAGSQIVLGSRLAADLDAAPGDTVTILAQDRYGSLGAANAELAGILEFPSAKLNQVFFVPLAVAQEMLRMPDRATELIVMLSDDDRATAVADRLRERLDPQLAIRTWRDNIFVREFLSLSKVVFPLLTGIFVLVSVLAITNTMLMAVFERTREVGLLGAMGLSAGGIVLVFVFEAAVIGIIGGLGGTGLGSLGGYYLETSGIRIGDVVSQAEVQIDSVLYGDLTWRAVIKAYVVGFLFAAAAGFFPALKAARLNPAAALRRR